MKQEISKAGLKSDFDSLAIAIIDKIVLPWNKMSTQGAEKIQQSINANAAELKILREDLKEAINAHTSELKILREAGLREQKRHTEEVDDAVSNSMDLVQDFSKKFSSINLPEAKDALRNAAIRHRVDKQSFEPTHTTLVALLEKTKGLSENLRNCEVKDKTSQRLWNWIFPSGCVLGVVLWIAFGFIFHSADRGFILALISVIGVPVCKYEYQKMRMLESWNQLLQAVAELEHFGKNIYLPKVLEENEKGQQKSLKQAEERHARQIEVLRKTMVQAEERHARKIEELRKTLVAEAKEIEAKLPDIDAQYRSLMQTGGCAVEDNKSTCWKDWQPEQRHVGWFRMGELAINTAQLSTTMSFLNNVVKLPLSFQIPALASIANGQSMVVRATDSQKAKGANIALKNFVFRLLANTPPGRVLFTFIDPIGQGNNATAFLELGDFHESLVNTKAWADSRQIENKLSEITAHMEEVIQKRLRDHATIEDYNQHNHQIAEAYRVVVIFDFPDSFNDNSTRQLLRIVQNGARCGVYALIVSNESHTVYGVDTGTLYKRALTIFECNGEYAWQESSLAEKFGDLTANLFLNGTLSLKLDTAPPGELVKRVTAKVGEASKEAFKVEIAFESLLEQVKITPDRMWQGDASQGLRVPIGLGSDGKPLFLDLGNGGLSFHVLLIGRPRSGKSNLMHVAITAAAMLYSPSELEIYLVDFKQGVEFVHYARWKLPHARVIAIQSEREFGLSVLRSLDAEIIKRGELFKKAGASGLGLPEYRAARASLGRADLPPLSRILLFVDEFQEFFIKKDALCGEAELLIDRLVRQGPAYGIHVMLASQTLGGYSIPKATKDLITVRIALNSSEADQRSILDDNNKAGRLLSRPGEGIYNSKAGLEEGNNFFQTALISDLDRQQNLKLMRQRFETDLTRNDSPFQDFEEPVVFEGHEPAIIENSKFMRRFFQTALRGSGRSGYMIYFGEPISLEPPCSKKLGTIVGNNLLLVSRDEREAVGVLAACLLSLLAQMQRRDSITLLNLSLGDSEWNDLPDQFVEYFPQYDITVVDRRDFPSAMENLAARVKRRLEGEESVDSRYFLIIVGLHRARDLRQEPGSNRFSFTNDGSSLPKQFEYVLREGPDFGVHILAWSDSLSSLEKICDRSTIGEFGTRLVGAMSDGDLNSLVDDSHAAAKLEHPNRLIKYDEEKVGVLEVFRPFTIPTRAWLEQTAKVIEAKND